MTITINARPRGVRDEFVVPHGTHGGVETYDRATGLLANDTDADGDHLDAHLATAPAHGQAIVELDGTFSYFSRVPGGLVVEDTFSYDLDDGVWPPTRINVYIQPLNGSPTASDQTIDLPHQAPVATLHFADPDGDPLALTLISGVQHGHLILNGGHPVTDLTGEIPFVYFPIDLLTGNGRGSPHSNTDEPDDTFTFRVTDQYGASADATVQIYVLNYAPATETVAYRGGDSLLRARNQGVGGDPIEGAILFEQREENGRTLAYHGGEAFAIDSDGDDVSEVLTVPPQYGTVSFSRELIDDGNAVVRFTYTPLAGAGAYGRDSFTYQLTDGLAESTPIRVDIRQYLGQIDYPFEPGLFLLPRYGSLPHHVIVKGDDLVSKYGPFDAADLAAGMTTKEGIPLFRFTQAVQILGVSLVAEGGVRPWSL